MFMQARRGVVRMMFMIALVGMIVPLSTGNLVRLEVRPINQQTLLDDVAEVGLYAVSLSGQDENFNAAQVIVTWDAAALQLVGVDATGAVVQPPVDTSAFIPGDSWGLNEADPPADGDGVWQGLVALGQNRVITPAGSLLTTLHFQTLSLTPCAEVAILDTVQLPGFARAFSKVVQGTFNVLDYGNLPTAACVTIAPEIVPPGDCDDDGDIDAGDFAALEDCLGGPDVLLTVDCVCMDFEPDLDVDLADVAAFQAAFTGP
jgi:hypothetical protein